MNYIKRTNRGIVISSEKKYEKLIGIKAYINSLCEPYLRTVDSVRKVIKKQFLIKTNIPIIVDRNTGFILTSAFRNYDCILLNRYEIISIQKVQQGSKIFFYNGEELLVNIGYDLLRKRIRQFDEISENYVL